MKYSPSSVQVNGHAHGAYDVGHDRPYLLPGPHAMGGKSRIASLKMFSMTVYVSMSAGLIFAPSCPELRKKDYVYVSIGQKKERDDKMHGRQRARFATRASTYVYARVYVRAEREGGKMAPFVIRTCKKRSSALFGGMGNAWCGSPPLKRRLSNCQTISPSLLPLWNSAPHV